MYITRSIYRGFLLVTDVVRCPFDHIGRGSSPIILWRDGVMVGMVTEEFETEFLSLAMELNIPDRSDSKED